MSTRGSFKSINLFLLFGLLCFLTVSKSEALIFGSIRGRAVDEITKEGIAGIFVRINIEGVSTSTDKDGYFKFEMVPSDEEYFIEVFVDQEPYYTKMYDLDVRLEKGKNILLKDIMARRGGAIEGKVKLWDGTPVSFMSVVAYAENENPGAYGGHPDANGNYRISKIPPNMDLKVIASCGFGRNVSRGYGRIKKEGIRVERDNITKGVDFIIPHDLAEIHGKVYSSDNKAIQAYLIFNKDNEEIGNICSNSEGYYSIKALEGGKYRIHVIYTTEDFQFTKDKEIYVINGDKIRIDVIISGGGIEFKEHDSLSEISRAPDIL